MITKKVRRKLYEYVVDELGQMIVSGQYPPGSTLPNEDALCRELNVSRGVIREAIKVLIQKGLVEARPKTGTLICPHSSWNLFDPDVLIWGYQAGKKLEFLQNTMEVRRIIEAEAAKLAAERASAEDVVKIRAAYEEMRKVLQEGISYSDEQIILLDLKFHTVILEACGNELIAQIGYTMRQALITARQSDRHDFESLKSSLPSHLTILEAIANHQPQQAYERAREHINKVWDDMQKSLAEVHPQKLG